MAKGVAGFPGIMVSFAVGIWLTFFAAAAHAENMHGEISRYDGPATCLECHETAAKEVEESLHYRLQSESTETGGGKVGYLADLSPLYGTLASIEWLEPGESGGTQACGLCHAGLGKLPGASAPSGKGAQATIDCLVCHSPEYRRVLRKDKGGTDNSIVPADGIDLVKAARLAQKPTDDMCRRCHDAANGAGPGYGIPAGEQDVHFSLGVGCIDCHPAKKHQVPGGAEHRAQELRGGRVACQNCHGEKPHLGPEALQLNRHSFRIACQTCHSPGIFSPGPHGPVTELDWSRPQKDPKTGRFYPALQNEGKGKPEYRWWDRSMSSAGEPVGLKRDRQAKIYPWRRITCTVVVDAVTGRPVPLKRAVYAETGDVGDAAKTGAAAAGIPYSGKWKTARTTVFMGLSHQVTPKSKALSCDFCHVDDGIDLKGLGYRQR